MVGLWSAGTWRFPLQKHPGTVVRQMPKSSRQPDSQGAGGVEAEEPDPGITSVNVHIRSDVGLVEAGKPRYGGKAGGADARHGEEHQAHVGFAIEKVEPQLLGKQGTDLLGSNCPVQEQQLPPVLPHRHWPGRAACGGESIHLVWSLALSFGGARCQKGVSLLRGRSDCFDVESPGKRIF